MKKSRALVSSLAMFAAATVAAQDAVVVSLSSQPLDVEEGSQLVWTFALSQPTPAAGLSVLIELTDDGDPIPGDIDYNVDGGRGLTQVEVLKRADGSIEGLQVSIAAGVDEAVMISQIVEDEVQEGPEPATWTLLNGEGYRADPAASVISYRLLDAE
ncbi:MAG: hypothetical protein EOM91_03625 [Sphingobacteriia bacterium]|nr:hypothetical protein [Sphingobacteriia bacterium]NCC39763.1 hypothetical protein [Gammaproteobacteria bacterium]